jgi:hypothetical protein
MPQIPALALGHVVFRVVALRQKPLKVNTVSFLLFKSRPDECNHTSGIGLFGNIIPLICFQD